MAGVGAPRRKELGLETVDWLPLAEEEERVVVRVRVRVAGGEREECRGGHHRRGEEPRELSRELRSIHVDAAAHDSCAATR